MNESLQRNENILLAEKVRAYHKFYYVDYKENNRGRFVKITEKDGQFRSTIIIPEEAVDDFAKILNNIVTQFSPAERTAAAIEEYEKRKHQTDSDVSD